MLQILTEGLEMGYPVSKRFRDGTHPFTAERDAEGKLKVPKLLIPWFRRSAEPASFQEKWTELQERRRLAVLFKFPCYMPPGLFELMTVRAHWEKHKLVFLAHWGGGVHARHSEEKVQLLMMYYREGAQDDADDNGDEEEEEEEEVEEEKEEEKMGGDRIEETMANGPTTQPTKDSGGSRGENDPDARERTLTSKKEDSTHPQRSRANIRDGRDNVKIVMRRKSRRQPQQGLDMPETIEELPEEELEEEEEEEAGELRALPADRLSVGPRGSDVQDTTELMHNGHGSESGPLLDKEGQTPEEVKVVKKGRSNRRRRPTESEGDDDGSIVLKFEVNLSLIHI